MPTPKDFDGLFFSPARGSDLLFDLPAEAFLEVAHHYGHQTFFAAGGVFDLLRNEEQVLADELLRQAREIARPFNWERLVRMAMESRTAVPRPHARPDGGKYYNWTLMNFSGPLEKLAWDQPVAITLYGFQSMQAREEELFAQAQNFGTAVTARGLSVVVSTATPSHPFLACYLGDAAANSQQMAYQLLGAQYSVTRGMFYDAEGTIPGTATLAA